MNDSRHRATRPRQALGPWFAVAVAVAFLFLIPATARAQCKVEGVVRQSDGTAVVGATVIIEIPEPNTTRTTTTDGEGRYGFEDIKPGIRVRVVVIVGGRSVVQSFTLVTLPVETLDIEVPPTRTTPLSTADVDPAGGPAGDVAGVVRSADGTPLAAARITINQTDLFTTTDSAGRYHFTGLRSGLFLALNASAPGFDPATKEIMVPADGRADGNLSLSPVSATERTGAELGFVDTPTDASAIGVRPAAVAGIPSLSPEDVFRGLQFLPGVPASMETEGALHVRGSTPGESRLSYDGFTLYEFGPFLGTFSPLNAEALRSANLMNASTSAAEGGRLAGAVGLTGESNATGKPTGFVEFGILGASGLASVPFGGRGSVLFAARRSLTGTRYNDVLDYLADTGRPSARTRTPRWSGGTFDAPLASSFYDWNGKLELKPTSKDTVAVSLYGGQDDFNDSQTVAFGRTSAITIPPAFDLPDDATTAVTDIRTWEARGTGVIWNRRWTPSVATTVSVGHSDTSVASDRASLLTSPSTGLDYSFVAGRGGSSAWSQTNRVRDTTVRLNTSIAVGFGHALSFGGEVASIKVDHSLGREAFQKTNVSAPYVPTLALLLSEASKGRLLTAYAQDSWRVTPRLLVSPGLRLTRYDVTGSTWAEPRVSGSFQLSRLFRAHGSWAIDHQAANRVTREDRMEGDDTFWSLANGTSVPVARSKQAVAGVRLDGPAVVVGVDAYRKTFEGLSLFAPRLLPGVTPTSTRSLFHLGTGTAQGLEWLLQWRWNWNTMWLSYAASLAEYRYPSLEAGTFPASHDHLHEFKVANTIRVGSRWTVNASWVAATGRPYTPTQSVGPVWFPSGAIVYEVTFGAKNSSRLPAYHRLDVSTRRDFQLRGFKATLGMTVFNLYDQVNVDSRHYQTVADALTVTEMTLMRRAVNVFLRVGF